MIRCLNLGCGYDVKVPGPGEALQWVNLDREPHEGVQVVADLEKPLPFENGEFDLVLASHVLEHVANYIPLVREIHRVLKTGGTLVARVPEFSCRAAVADPTHVRQFVPESFFHLIPHNMGYDSGGLAGLFDLDWLERFLHDRPSIDRGVVGSYFTEILVELTKRSAGGDACATGAREQGSESQP